MKILVVSQYYYPERFSVTDICEELVKQGHEVSVVTGRPNYGFHHILKEYKHTKYEEINGVKINRLKIAPRKLSRISIINNYLSFWFFGKRFAKHIKEKFDVVLSISLSPVISISPALKYAKKNNVPCVLYCQDLWPESTLVTKAVRKNSLTYKALFKWSKSIYSKCDKIVISSPSFKDYFEKELGIVNKTFNVVNQPILLSNSSEKPVIYENNHNLVYAGNIGKIQLTDLLIDAIKLIKTKDAKLHLMGMGSELEQIKAKIAKDNLQDKVVYEGAFPIEKAETYYKNADALIVSLKNEGYVGKTIPNKAIQYMKYGKPLVVVAEGDAKEMLKKAKGSIFAKQNPKDIAEAFDKIFALREKDQFGLNNKTYFENNFTTEKLTHLLVDELMSAKK